MITREKKIEVERATLRLFFQTAKNIQGKDIRQQLEKRRFAKLFAKIILYLVDFQQNLWNKKKPHMRKTSLVGRQSN